MTQELLAQVVKVNSLYVNGKQLQSPMFFMTLLNRDLKVVKKIY